MAITGTKQDMPCCSKVCRKAQHRYTHRSVENGDPTKFCQFSRSLGVGKSVHNSYPKNIDLRSLYICIQRVSKGTTQILYASPKRKTPILFRLPPHIFPPIPFQGTWTSNPYSIFEIRFPKLDLKSSPVRFSTRPQYIRYLRRAYSHNNSGPDTLQCILCSVNVSLTAIDWFHIYLFSRRQWINIHNTVSF